jgi:hypothetical protein
MFTRILMSFTAFAAGAAAVGWAAGAGAEVGGGAGVGLTHAVRTMVATITRLKSLKAFMVSPC